MSTESEESAGSGWAPGSSGRASGATGHYASGPARDIVRRARALGVTLFDTAEVYGLGKSERILGEALGDERTEVAVASKIFPVAPFPPSSSSASAPARAGCSWTASRSIKSTSPTRWFPTR